MSEVITVLARLEGDAKGAVNAFQDADRAARNMADQAERTSKDAQGSMGRMESGAKRMAAGIAGALLGAFSIAAVANWGKETIASLGRIESINAQTAAALESTGAAAWVTQGHIETLAGQLEMLTATEAESVQEGANLLLTFKNIQNQAGAGNNIFDQAVMSMTDMARAMGTDAAGGAIQLGKALNDPVAGIAALSRVGVTFTGDQEAMIRSMVAAGDVMGAQKIILAELNSQFGGSGEAYAATYAGQVDLLKHSFGGFSEALLGGVMPVLAQLAGMGSTAFNWLSEQPAVTGFGQSIVDAFSRMQEVLAPVGQAFAPVLNAFSQLAGPVMQLVTAFSPLGLVLQGLTPVLPVITNLLTQVASILNGALTAALPVVTGLVEQLAGFLSGALSAVLPIVANMVGTLGGALQRIMPSVMEVAGALGGALMTVLTAMEPVLPIIWGALESVLAALMPLIPAVLAIVQAFVPFIEIAGELIAAILPPLVELLAAVLTPVLALVSPLLELLVPALEWVADAIGTVVDWLLEGSGGMDAFAAVVDFVAAGVSNYFQAMGVVIGAVMDGVAAVVDFVVGAVSSQFETIMGVVGVVGETFRNVFGAIGDFISNAFSNALGVVKGAINGIIGLVNGAIGALNNLRVDIPDWVPLVGGTSFGVNLPTIPMLANGGEIMAPGLTWVGERGPELLSLPRGATVAPLGKIDVTPQGGREVTINLSIDAAGGNYEEWRDRLLADLRWALQEEAS